MAQNKNPCNMTTFIIIIAKYEQNPSKRKGEDRYTRFDGWLGPKQYNSHYVEWGYNMFVSYI